MKIIMLSNELSPYKIFGGLGIALNRLVNQLKATKKNEIIVVLPVKKISKEIKKDKIVKPFVFKNINYNLSDKKIASYFSSLNEKILEKIKEINPEKNSIIIAHDNETALSLLLIKNIYPEIKKIFWLHSLYDYLKKESFEDKYQKLFSKKSLIASAIDCSDLIITSSGIIEEVKNFSWPNFLKDIQLSILEGIKNEKIITVESLGCLPKKIKINKNIKQKNKKEFFLFPSRPTFSKGIGFFGEISNKFNDKYDFFSIGPIEEEIKTLYPKIKEIDWLKQEDLFILMNSAKAVLIPSITEGYGLSAAESSLVAKKTIYHSIGGQTILDFSKNCSPITLTTKQKKMLYLFWSKLLENKESPIKTWKKFKKMFSDIIFLWEESIINEKDIKRNNNQKNIQSWASILETKIEKKM